MKKKYIIGCDPCGDGFTCTSLLMVHENGLIEIIWTKCMSDSGNSQEMMNL